MERRALAVSYPLIVEEHALGWTAEAQDVAQHLDRCRRGQETSTGGRRADVVRRERHTLEHAVGAAYCAAVLIIQFVEAHV